MEFNEKLQELRGQRSLTQEELAEALYVSRTAISKWESGRGYPSIESLKAISKYFSTSLDELLSSDEIITIAQEDNKQKVQHFRDLVFGLLDCAMAMFLILPIFGQRIDGVIQGVSLLSLREFEWYVKMPYLVIVFGLMIWGIVTLTFQNCTATFWVKNKVKVSLILSVIGSFIFMISPQPYAAMFTFIFLVIKGLILIKWA